MRFQRMSTVGVCAFAVLVIGLATPNADAGVGGNEYFVYVTPLSDPTVVLHDSYSFVERSSFLIFASGDFSAETGIVGTYFEIDLWFGLGFWSAEGTSDGVPVSIFGQRVETLIGGIGNADANMGGIGQFQFTGYRTTGISPPGESKRGRR